MSDTAGTIRVGLAGVGNCASSFLQGIAFYGRSESNEPPPGLMNVELGGYRAADIEISAAFDVNVEKVGKDVAEAIFARPNNTICFERPGPTGVTVRRGPTLDGLGKYLRDLVRESDEEPVDVVGELHNSRTQVLVSYLPVGSQKAAEHYADCAIRAGCAFVNCMPVFIASDDAWRRRFEHHGLPIVGDDIKSQFGATIVHRVLTNLLRQRGVRVDRTYQLNFGGNTDFLNMLERERLSSKKISKTRAVNSQLEVPLSPENMHIGPSDYVPWLTDRKNAYIRLEGTTFGGVPLSLELKLEVWDSPNSAGVVIDAVRCAKLALDRRMGGALVGPSSYFMKSPPEQFTDDEARRRTLEFVHGKRQAA